MGLTLQGLAVFIAHALACALQLMASSTSRGDGQIMSLELVAIAFGAIVSTPG
jgi:hypothetical protein